MEQHHKYKISYYCIIVKHVIKLKKLKIKLAIHIFCEEMTHIQFLILNVFPMCGTVFLHMIEY